MKRTRIAICALALCWCGIAAAAQQVLQGAQLRVRIDGAKGHRREVFSIPVEGVWQDVLMAASAVRIETDRGPSVCPIDNAEVREENLILSGECGAARFEQRLSLTAELDVVQVVTRVEWQHPSSAYSVEDRYEFLPPRNQKIDEHTGPLDFVWSQNIKSEAGDLIPEYSFKSPALMMQQGRAFAALMPRLNLHHAEARALDLDVTSEARPWMAYGAIPSEPHDHSYFRRAKKTTLETAGGAVEYEYALVLSDQPARLGYRRVVRRLWEQMGHPALVNSPDEQKNLLRPGLSSFASWREEAWKRYAGSIYREIPCGARMCGTLSSDRNVTGEWDRTEHDAWFNAWFESLRSAYGWYVHGRQTGDAGEMRKAESILNLALDSPRSEGAFATIYLAESHTWKPGDGWAGFGDSYHTFSMSWTAYWMLRWAEDLEPKRKEEILRFVRPYGDFLLRHETAAGAMPSWYIAATMEPRREFRDFSAEGAPSALFLAELGKVSGEKSYIDAAARAMRFIEREVTPRQRWFDFETFLSCARKDFAFFDRWTAQYPQNNLAEIEAPEAMLSLYRLTGDRSFLESGERMMDYLLLTQQVWNNPRFTPHLLGGFTTQNTDQEWSDARQGYAAVVLADYYDATGRFEYMERAVGALRSTFSIAPWENWAHTGYEDQPGAMTGFHWGTGSATTTLEILEPRYGEAWIDAKAGQGVGIDECSVTDVTIESDAISFRIASAARTRRFLVRFRGLERDRIYRVRWNGGAWMHAAGSELMERGIEAGPVG
jgi:hypothetical protein